MALTNAELSQLSAPASAWLESKRQRNRGTINVADRFIRGVYSLKSSHEYEDRETATASVFLTMRSIGIALGMGDPDHPDIPATLWRTASIHDAANNQGD